MLQNTVVAVNVSTSSSNSTSSSSSSFKLKYKYRFIQLKGFYMEKQFNKTKFTCVLNMYNYCHTQFQVPLLSGSSVIKTAEV